MQSNNNNEPQHVPNANEIALANENARLRQYLYSCQFPPLPPSEPPADGNNKSSKKNYGQSKAPEQPQGELNVNRQTQQVSQTAVQHSRPSTSTCIHNQNQENMNSINQTSTPSANVPQQRTMSYDQQLHQHHHGGDYVQAPLQPPTTQRFVQPDNSYAKNRGRRVNSGQSRRNWQGAAYPGRDRGNVGWYGCPVGECQQCQLFCQRCWYCGGLKQ